jgi:hypothetical protein
MTRYGGGSSQAHAFTMAFTLLAVILGNAAKSDADDTIEARNIMFFIFWFLSVKGLTDGYDQCL